MLAALPPPQRTPPPSPAPPRKRETRTAPPPSCPGPAPLPPAPLQVRFHPLLPGLLATAAADGLACVLDAAAAAAGSGAAAGDALAAVLAAGEPVTRLGFAGPDGGRLFCVTAAEGLLLWALPAGDPLARADDLRPALAAAPPPPPPRLAATPPPPPCDYVVDAAYDAAGDRLLVLAGARAGALGVWALAGAGAGAAPPAPVGAALAAPPGRGGHTDTVRAAAWDLAGGALCTGGEDCRLALWRWADDAAAADAADAAADAAAGRSEDGPGKARTRHRQAWAPY